MERKNQQSQLITDVNLIFTLHVEQQFNITGNLILQYLTRPLSRRDAFMVHVCMCVCVRISWYIYCRESIKSIKSLAQIENAI